jgi:hypothetical protein
MKKVDSSTRHPTPAPFAEKKNEAVIKRLYDGVRRVSLIKVLGHP